MWGFDVSGHRRILISTSVPTYLVALVEKTTWHCRLAATHWQPRTTTSTIEILPRLATFLTPNSRQSRVYSKKSPTFCGRL